MADGVYRDDGQRFAADVTDGVITPKVIAAVTVEPAAGASTEAKQDDAIAILETLGTQTTLAAILAKIIAAPATAANQTTLIGHLDGVEALLAAATPAGANEIGKINWRHINVLGATLTRPADVTPYTTGDSISNNATPGDVIALSSNDLSDVNDDPINLTEILLDTTDTGPGAATAIIRCHLFNSDPTLSSGVVAGDNTTWSNKKAGWFGSFSGILRPFSDGSRGILLPDEGVCRIAFPASGARNIWWQLQTLSNFTPSANSTIFIPRFKGLQGRI